MKPRCSVVFLQCFQTVSHMRKAFNKVDDDMQIDSTLFNPDELWKRPQVCSFRMQIDTAMFNPDKL